MDLTFPFRVYLDGDEKPVAAFRYRHHAEAWAEDHAGRVSLSGGTLPRAVLDESDGLDPYRVKA